MAELPIVPIGRIIKNAGAPRISEEAKETLAKVLEEMGEKLILESVSLAKHAGRKTVKDADINLVINTYNIHNTNSRDVNINQELEIFSLKELYQKIDNKENSNQIKERVKSIENELRKPEINQSIIKTSVDWLKRNASWTIPTITQILLSTLALK
ncbi:MAG: histone family protein [Euryarchaeota archaeon]|nr:histone family protein [Euryarchaeota archaeon]MBU4608203.1 histone family protein [Euryarchaeota archaeon]MBV1729503.1 histone family protein [Methanobacterium sp.]MBV1754862.1 histone family protein [Methanobacterium sp.]